MKLIFKIFIISFIAALLNWNCKEKELNPDADQQELIKITNVTYNGVYDAVISPGKTKIIYWFSDASQKYEIRICDIDGKNDNSLVKEDLVEGIVISENEQKLAFQNNINTSHGNLSQMYLLDIPSKNCEKIFENTPGDVYQLLPKDFSKDNSLLLVNVYRNVSYGSINSVGIYNIQTQALTILSDSNNASPISFSTSGSEILFYNNEQLCRMDTNGTNIKVLANQFINIYCKGYSNNSNEIYFTGTKIGDVYARNIYRVDDDGSNLTKLTKDTMDTYFRDVSLDNQLILYNSNKRTKNLRMDVYEMDMNMNEKILLESPYDDRVIGFAAQSNKIIIKRYSSPNEPTNLYLLENK